MTRGGGGAKRRAGGKPTSKSLEVVSEVPSLKDRVSSPLLKQEAVTITSSRGLYTMPADFATSEVPTTPSATISPTCDVIPRPHPIPLSTVPTFGSTLGYAVGEQALREEVKAQGVARREAMEDSPNTDSAYSRHYRDYQDWWELDQGQRRSNALAEGKVYVHVPALPILSFKACLFLEYSRTRPRTNSKGKPIPNTSLSTASLTQIVSALESYRFLETGSKADKLRDDFNIQRILEDSERSEAQRQQDAQITKAIGVQSQTISRDQLKEVGMKLLYGSKNAKELGKCIHDRAMLLVSVSMAMRGDNVRPICWSDIILRDVSLINMGLDYKTKALLIYSNQGKTNKSAKQDFHPAVRHRFPELCAIGGTAMQLFFHFHVAKIKLPSFSPNYDASKGSEYGHREWYERLLFPSDMQSPDQQMTPSTHRRRVNAFKLRFDIFSQKVTHIGRTRGALDGRDFGATIEGIKKLGIWRAGGSFENAYDQGLPIDAMLALAYFNGETKNDYCVARDFLEPPEELEAMIFPFLDGVLAEYNARHLKLGRLGKDEALVNFVNTLRFFRRVLLQDVAALVWENGREGFQLLDYPPFNSPLFLQFAAMAGSVIEEAEANAKENRKNLPEMLTQAYVAQLTAVHAQQLLAQRQLEAYRNEVVSHLHLTSEIVRGGSSASGSSKKRKATSQSIQDFPHPPRPPPFANMPPLPSKGAPTGTPPGTSQASPPSPPEQPLAMVSGAGAIYSMETFPLSDQLDVRALQMQKITELEEKFTEEKLRFQVFEWASHGKVLEWYPRFEWCRLPSLAEIWSEYAIGIGHRFSLLELESHWGARWKRDSSSIKSEWTRRSKVHRLVSALVQENSWSSDEALRYLATRYPIVPQSPDSHLRTSRSFMDWLNKSRAEEIVLSSRGFALGQSIEPSI